MLPIADNHYVHFDHVSEIRVLAPDRVQIIYAANAHIVTGDNARAWIAVLRQSWDDLVVAANGPAWRGP